MSENIYIIGVGMVKFGKFLERSVKDWTGEVLDNLFKDCDLTRDDLQAAPGASSTGCPRALRTGGAHSSHSRTPSLATSWR